VKPGRWDRNHPEGEIPLSWRGARRAGWYLKVSVGRTTPSGFACHPAKEGNYAPTLLCCKGAKLWVRSKYPPPILGLSDPSKAAFKEFTWVV
jgi:hypothetical protein